MFETLNEKIENIVKSIQGRAIISEKDLDSTMREIRIVLLEADVALPVVKDFIENVKKNIIGQEVLKSIKPDQMIIKLVEFTYPLYFILALLLTVVSTELVIYWLGPVYLDSVPILRILSIMSVFGFLIMPSTLYFVAYEKTKSLYYLSICTPTVFFASLKNESEKIAFRRVVDQYLSTLIKLSNEAKPEFKEEIIQERIDYQKNYCVQQMKNEKTSMVLLKYFDEKWVNNYIKTVLFDF